MPRSFNSGSSQYLERSASPLAGPYPSTLAVWYRTNGGGNPQQIISVVANGSVERLQLRIGGANQVTGIVGASDGSNSAAVVTPTVTNGAWQHAAYVCTHANLRTVYMNGGNAASDTTHQGQLLTYDTVGVGRSPAPLISGYFNGLVAHAAVWNAPLSSGEIAALAAGTPPWRIRPAALVAYWPLDGLGSPEPDYGGRGYNLTVNGATAGAGGPPIWLPRWAVSCEESAAGLDQELDGAASLPAACAIWSGNLAAGSMGLAGPSLASRCAIRGGSLAIGAVALPGVTGAASFAVSPGSLTAGSVALAGPPLALSWVIARGRLHLAGAVLSGRAVAARCTPSGAVAVRVAPSSATAARVAPSSAEVIDG